jgi:hypothetical protein
VIININDFHVLLFVASDFKRNKKKITRKFFLCPVLLLKHSQVRIDLLVWIPCVSQLEFNCLAFGLLQLIAGPSNTICRQIYGKCVCLEPPKVHFIDLGIDPSNSMLMTAIAQNKIIKFRLSTLAWAKDCLFDEMVQLKLANRPLSALLPCKGFGFVLLQFFTLFVSYLASIF